MPISTWLLKARNAGSVHGRKREGKFNRRLLPVFDEAVPNGIKGKGKCNTACASPVKHVPDILDEHILGDGQHQVGNGNKRRPPALTAAFGTMGRYQLPEYKENSATATSHPPRQQRDPGKRVKREDTCEPKCETVATRSLKELLQVAADTAASAELAVHYVDESSKRAAGGNGIVAVVQAAAEASVLAKRAAEQAYVSLEQTADGAQKNHYQKSLRKAFHQTLVKSAIANYLAGRANQAVQAVEDAATTVMNPAEALADFIAREIHFMMVEYENYHPTSEEVAKIDALAATAKLALEQTENTLLDHPLQSERGLSKTGHLTKTEVVLSQDGMGWKDAITVGMTIAAEGAIGLAGAFAAFGEGAAEAAGETAVTASEGALNAAVEATSAIGEALGDMEALSGLEGGRPLMVPYASAGMTMAAW